MDAEIYPEAPTSPTDDVTRSGTPRSTIVAAVAGVCVAILVLVLGASAWYFRRRRNRRRQLQASGSPRPYGMRTPQGTSTSVVGSSRREEKQVALGFEVEHSAVQKTASSALASAEQDGASGSMEALHGAVLRAGFSVDTLMHSLGRVHAEQHPLSAEGGRVQSFVTTDSPPTYVEDDTSVRR
ncbi:hypothetical protein EXIGLDRAFT_210231 [Exidia glandulosa HHB12029]|uniref:Uncharacterized protein n=1 Tax=Exidia glandulosa HHB12029 TaxID=1314781 RepID=A0A165EK76_EXIGL|nr:hypothetical protein EXIGLDRAFT_210231 [Exidia glandulosa HHB12029]